MKRTHKVQINVADRNGNKQKVLECRYKKIPKRLLKLIFGEFCEIVILSPGKSVEGMIIQEMAKRQDNECSHD